MNSIMVSNQLGGQMSNATRKNCFVEHSNELPGPSRVNFAIPTINISREGCVDPKVISVQPMSELNKFLLGQLQERNITPNSGFVLPKLNKALKENIKFKPPALERFTATISRLKDGRDHDLSALNDELQNSLHINEKGPTSVIDLSLALSNQTSLPNTGFTTQCSPKKVYENLDITFIEKGKWNEATKLPIFDEGCQTDVSHLRSNCMATPSRVARIICLDFERASKFLAIDHSYKTKHKIRQFGFNTKSVDDVILENLYKYQR